MYFQSECACLHKTVNIVVFFVRRNENTYPKGRAELNRVVPQTKRGNCGAHSVSISCTCI